MSEFVQKQSQMLHSREGISYALELKMWEDIERAHKLKNGESSGPKVDDANMTD